MAGQAEETLHIWGHRTVGGGVEVGDMTKSLKRTLKDQSGHVVNKLSRQNITDMIKLSFWCFNNRNKIVYTNENNNKVVLMIRSLLFPILLYQYFDYK